MNKIKQTLAVIFVIAIFVSCGKEEIEPKETVEKASINAKWNVSNSDKFESFEFNESGNYIVVENKIARSTDDQKIHFGTYELIDDQTAALEDFGHLTISGINEKSIRFSLQFTNSSDSTIEIHASKQEEMKTSTRTELLCRTWKMVSVNGEDVVGTEYELSVLFSKAGTYFVEFANPEDEDDGGLAHWKWFSNTETRFLYSWENPPVWEDEEFVEILDLTNHSLKIRERLEDDEDYIYHLVPANNTKSGNKSAVKQSQGDKPLKSGFLKRSNNE